MNTQTIIEFDKIKTIWAGLTSTDHAKQKISEADIILDERTLRKALQDTTDSRALIEKLGNPPVQNVTEIREVLKTADSGKCLTPCQIERVEKVLVAVERMIDYLSRGKQYENSLAYYDENLDPLSTLKDEINRQIRNEEVDDRATKELYEIRNRIAAVEESVKQKAEQIIGKNKAYMADSYYTMRNGRVCVPVKKEYRAKIPGSVIDKSATGNTLFVEPEGVAKCYEELELLRIDEENEVYRILYILTAMVVDSASILEENIKMMEKLDYIFSKGKLSIDLDCIEPAINLERRIKLVKARHPLMDKNVNIPLDFLLGDGDINGIVITGPNTGGKTVAIKTVMLSCYMAQCGLHVACREADICMNSNYLSDIGDGQNLSENLSTFSAHIKNVLNILGSVDQESFVIMDELGSGTDPAEGMGIAVSILEELRKSGANFLVTTHYPEIKEYASRAEHITNARMAFDKDTLRPTYEMIIGEAGESCAFYIAQKLGMPKEMLKVAQQAAYGNDAALNSMIPDDNGADRNYEFLNKKNAEGKNSGGRIVRAKKKHPAAELKQKFSIGDSVMIYPDRKTGIVCEPINDKGILRVQLPDGKIYVNHKRVKLLVKAAELYPEDYDFSIIFDTVANRKARHEMSRKLTDKVIVYDSPGTA